MPLRGIVLCWFLIIERTRNADMAADLAGLNHKFARRPGKALPTRAVLRCLFCLLKAGAALVGPTLWT